MSTSNRSRTVLLYSALLSRRARSRFDSVLVDPSIRSNSVSIQPVTSFRSASLGRGNPFGGISPAWSFRRISSNSLRSCSITLALVYTSRFRPPTFRLELWQGGQGLSAEQSHGIAASTQNSPCLLIKVYSVWCDSFTTAGFQYEPLLFEHNVL